MKIVRHTVLSRALACAAILLVGAPASGLWASAISAQPEAGAPAEPPSRPAFANREVAVYDFEEPDNPFEVPADFFRAQSDPVRGIDRPGYPVFNRPAFDTAHARSGERSVRLPIVRGSVCLRLRPGGLPVFADADYAVTVHARSEGIEHARFRLVLRLLDDAGEAIDGAEWLGEPVLPGDAWEPVTVSMAGGRYENASFLQIDAEVVQPVEFGTPSLGEHQVWSEDYSGAVWIDDMVVTQLPRIVLRPMARSGVVVEPEAPELSLLVRDLTGERLMVTMVTRDHTGRVVDRQSRPVRSSSVPTVWTPVLPRLGWYRVEAVLESAGVVVTNASCDLVYTTGPGARRDAEGAYDEPDLDRFAYAADGWDPAILSVLPELGAKTRTHGLTLGLWSESLQPEQLEAINEQLSALLRSIDHSWEQPAISLPELPTQLRQVRTADAYDIIPTLMLDLDIWAPYIEPSLERLGEIVRRWRFGALGTVPPQLTDLAASMRHIQDEFAVLVPAPRLGVAWLPSLSFGPLEGVPDLKQVSAYFEPGTGSGVVRDTVDRWVESARSDDAGLTLAFGSATPGRFAASGGAAELVRRIIEAEAAIRTAPSLPSVSYELVEPWAISDREGITMPHPSIAVWRATIDRLSGRRVAADLGFVPGTRVYLLTPHDPESDRGGALVAWNESATPENAVVEINLGDRPVTLVDIWGNRSATVDPMSEAIGQGREIQFHRIELGREPVFVEGIDVDLALFTSSVRLDEPVIQATPGPHTRSITLTNPWQVAIDGNAIILEPAERLLNGRATGWDITPRVRRFNAGPGETIEIPIEISFSAVEASGRKPFVVDLALTSGPMLERVRASSTLDIRLDGIELDARVVIADSGSDAAIELIVTNTTGDTVDLNVHSAARGYPRQSASIVGLQNGASVVRRFMYPGAVSRLTGESIFVGVEDPMRRGRLNRVVPF